MELYCHRGWMLTLKISSYVLTVIYTSLNFYLDMANKGIKAPSAKQLRMMSALGQFFGGKEF